MSAEDIKKIEELDIEINKLESEKEELEKKNRIELEAKRKEEEAIKEKNKVVRFNADIESRVINALGDLFNSPDESISEEEMITNDWAVIDACNVLMVYGKSNRAKRTLARFVDKNSELTKKKLPDWDFVEKEGKPAKSAYSTEYLTKIMKLLEINSDRIIIQTKWSHPLKIENDDFICILAPRIEMEEDTK